MHNSVQYGIKPLQILHSSFYKGISFVTMKLPFDEMLDAAGKARPHYQIFHNWLKQQGDALIGLKHAEADLIFRRVALLLPSMVTT
jgi:hypothetical protein